VSAEKAVTHADITPTEIEVRTRDGVTVRADVYLPEGEGPFPVLLAASAYQKALAHLPVHGQFPFRESGPIDFYLANGYAYVWMDVPGTGRSDGDWDPVSKAEGAAIADVIEDVAARSWCTGRVGMIGQSYYCWSQWNAARMRPPSLATIVAFDGATDLYRDWTYKGGIPDFGFLSSWTASVMLQHQAMGMPIDGGNRNALLTNVYSHPYDDEWQRERSPFWDLDQVDIPVLSIGAWCKGSLHMRGNVEGFGRLRGPKKLLMLGAANPGVVQQMFATTEFHATILLPWYDHHLKGVPNGVMDGPDVRLWVNRGESYRAAETWPPEPATQAAFALSATPSGAARSLNDGSLVEQPAAVSGTASTSFSYPDAQWTVGTSAMGPNGPDHVARILTFTSPAFDRVREFTGDGHVVLFASTDQQEIDVVVRLSVIGPSGADLVGRGWLRASHRQEDETMSTPMRPFHLHNSAQPVTPGEVYELRVPLVPMSFLVRPGERLRLEMSNGDAPLLEGRMFQWYGLKAGADTYFHDDARPSRLVLPEMPDPTVGEE
jgi:predicted acyl esterase